MNKRFVTIVVGIMDIWEMFSINEDAVS